MNKRIDIGAVAEYHFAAELLYRGLVPAWPSTEQQPYDMIVDTGKRRLRVQVKGTEKPAATVEVQFSMSDGKSRRAYNSSDIDFIALHLFEYQLWYIFPVRKVNTGVSIKPGDPSCKYKRYQEAWHLLDKSLKK